MKAQVCEVGLTFAEQSVIKASSGMMQLRQACSCVMTLVKQITVAVTK